MTNDNSVVDLRECPSEWHREELGNLCIVSGGFAAPKSDEPFKEGAIPFVRMQDLGRYHRTTNLVETKDKLNKNFVTRHRLRIIQRGSILVPRSGSVSLNHRAVLGIDACIVSHICALTVNSPRLDNRYLYYTLCNFDMRKIMRKTTGLDAITFEDVKGIEIPIPPIETQRAIAGILNRVSSLRDKREQATQLTNKIIQSVFLKMFGEPSTNPKFEITTVEAVCSDIIDCPHSTPTYTNAGVPLVRTPNIKRGYLDMSQTKFISVREHQERSRRIHPTNGDILYAREATFGNAALVDTNEEFSVGQRIMLLRPNTKLVKSEFLASMIKSDHVYGQAATVARGSTNPHVNVADVKKFNILLPPIEMQDTFAAIASRIKTLRGKQDASALQINGLFHSLMSKAFKGELMHDIPETQETRHTVAKSSTLTDYMAP